MTEINPTSEPKPQASGNGLAVAALTIGIIGSLFGVIPLTFFLAWILGILAVVFGAVGRRRPVGKTMATWGLVLGILSIGLGIVGVVAIDRAVDEFKEDIDDIFDEISEDIEEIE